MSRATPSQPFQSCVDPDMENRLMQASLQLEAERCRLHAAAFEGRPEKVILLRLASEFDRLSLLSPKKRRQPAEDDRSLF